MTKFIKRRSFLANSAKASLAASIIPSSLFACSTKQSGKKLGVALVGLGSYSSGLLAPALQMTDYCELKGIVTGSPDKIPVWQRKYGIQSKNVYNYDNMHQIADNDEIDVVYIVVPTALHAKYAIIAANTGKHVWCEKPMAKTVEACQAIIDACNKNKVKLSIGYRMHHEPNTQKIMEWSDTKPYGAIQKASAKAGYNGYRGENVDLNYWRLQSSMGGNPLYDMGVYSINGLRYAVGKEPIKVISARHETTRPDVFKYIEETTYFELEFPDGIIGQGATSYGINMNELRVECSNGWYELSPFQAYSGIQGQTSDGKKLNALLGTELPYQQARQMDHDAQAILNKEAVMVPGKEGLLDIKVVEAIFKSAKTGESVSIL